MKEQTLPEEWRSRKRRETQEWRKTETEREEEGESSSLREMQECFLSVLAR